MANFTPLTPAEALALLDPAKATAREALKVTLMALLGERRLRMEQTTEKPRFGRAKTVSRMSAASESGAPPPHVASLLKLVRSIQPATMAEVVKKATAEYGAGFARFLKTLVMPSLMARGLIEERVKTVLFLFKSRAYEPTPAGLAERRRLENLMAQARDIPNFLDSDPKKAAALAVALGGLIFLMPELRPYMQEIGAAMRAPASAPDHYPGDSGSSPSSVSYDAPAGGEKDIEIASGMDWGGFDDAAFETLSAEMDSFESSFDSSADSGGGDGGGDGGGGDGGGD